MTNKNGKNQSILGTVLISRAVLAEKEGFARLRAGHAGCKAPPAPCQEPAFEALPQLCCAKNKDPLPSGRGSSLFGGEGGIRTLERLLTVTRFPIVRARPNYATSPRVCPGVCSSLDIIINSFALVNCFYAKGERSALAQERRDVVIAPCALPAGAGERPFRLASLGTCLAAARSRRGSDMPPACHSLPRRRYATLRRGGFEDFTRTACRS